MNFALDSQGLILIPLEVFHTSKVSISVLVDTGSSGTVFDIDLFDIDLFQPNASVVKLVGVGGEQEVLVQTVGTLAIGEVIAKDLPVQFGDISDKFGFQGILGADLLSRFGTTIDYRNARIDFAPRAVNEFP